MFSRHHLFFVGLVILFAASFVTPIVVGTHLAGVRSVPPTAPIDATFPESKSITGKSDGIVIKHSTALDPTPGEDFLVLGWFKPRVLPKDGQRTVLFSKFEPEVHLGPGYAVGLEGDNGHLRPIVYWRDNAGKGRWLTFAELPEATNDWFLVALSLHDSKYLGVHGAFLDPNGGKPRVLLLGGYDVSAIELPHSGGDVIIGSGGSRRFVGRIGPFGVFSLPSFSGDFDRMLKDLVRNPLDPSEVLSSREIKFWSSDLTRDESSNAHQIVGVMRPPGGGSPLAMRQGGLDGRRG